MNKKSNQLIVDTAREPVRERVLYVDSVKIVGQDLNQPSEVAITNFKSTFKEYIRDKRIEENDQAAAI